MTKMTEWDWRDTIMLSIGVCFGSLMIIVDFASAELGTLYLQGIILIGLTLLLATAYNRKMKSLNKELGLV